MVAVVVPILTLLLGALVGGVAKAIQDRYIVFQEARAVAVALRAELSALVEDFKDPGTIAMVDRTIEHLSAPSHVVQADDFLEIPVTENPFQVFDAHCAKLGLLGDAVEAVVA